MRDVQAKIYQKTLRNSTYQLRHDLGNLDICNPDDNITESELQTPAEDPILSDSPKKPQIIINQLLEDDPIKKQDSNE